MGGEASGCSETTTNVFLEVAYFDPVLTARSARKLGIQSDARYRFERGIDPESCRWGVEVATRLILELCGGEASHAVSAGTLPAAEKIVTLRPDRVATLGGVAVPAAEQQAHPRRARLRGDAAGDGLTAAVPSWRGDIVGEADLVEEVLRIRGYDTIPAVPLPRLGDLPEAVLTETQRRRTQIRQTLAWRGLEEVVTFSFMDGRLAERFGGGAGELTLANPISADLDAMRPSILPQPGRRGGAQRRRAASPTWRCSRSARSIATTARRASS